MEGFSSNCPNWKAPMGNHGSDFKNYRENTALQFMFDIFHPLQICIKFCFIPLNLHHFLYGKSKNFRQGRAFGEGPGFYPPWGDFGIFTLGWRYCYFSTPFWPWIGKQSPKRWRSQLKNCRRNFKLTEGQTVLK